MTSMALGFDGNLDARKGYLDPDTYAVEGMRAEFSRLNVTERFCALLNRLGDFLVPPNPRVLFIQPVVYPIFGELPKYFNLFRSPYHLVLVAESDV